MYSPERNAPRPYQEEAIERINSEIMYGKDRALLLMATGLGKTRVAAGVIEQWINDRSDSQVLVLSPSLETCATTRTWPVALLAKECGNAHPNRV